MYIKEQGGHLKGMRAGGGQQHPGDTQLIFQESMALLGVIPVARNVAALDGVLDVLVLLASE